MPSPLPKELRNRFARWGAEGISGREVSRRLQASAAACARWRRQIQASGAAPIAQWGVHRIAESWHLMSGSSARWRLKTPRSPFSSCAMRLPRPRPRRSLFIIRPLPNYGSAVARRYDDSAAIGPLIARQLPPVCHRKLYSFTKCQKRRTSPGSVAGYLKQSA